MDKFMKILKQQLTDCRWQCLDGCMQTSKRLSNVWMVACKLVKD